MDIYVRGGARGNKNSTLKYKYVFLESEMALMHLYPVRRTARAGTPTPLLRQALSNLSAAPVPQDCYRAPPKLYVLIVILLWV
jgi:hypothetical protein